MPRVLQTGVVGTDSAVVDAAGTASVRIAPTSTNFNWSVSQVSIEMPTAPAGAAVVIRRNGSLVAPGASARLAAAAGDPPIILRSGDEMTVEWSGCTAGDQGRVLYIYNEVPVI